MKASCILALLVVAALGCAHEAPVSSVATLRREATVVTTQDGYVVTTRFLGTSVFDPASNAQINRQRAEELCVTALSKHLDTQRLTISGMRIISRTNNGNVWEYVFLVPSVTPAECGMIQHGSRNTKRPSYVDINQVVIFRGSTGTPDKRSYVGEHGGYLVLTFLSLLVSYGLYSRPSFFIEVT